MLYSFYGGFFMVLFNDFCNIVVGAGSISILGINAYRASRDIYSKSSEKKEFHVSDDCRFDAIKNESFCNMGSIGVVDGFYDGASKTMNVLFNGDDTGIKSVYGQVLLYSANSLGLKIYSVVSDDALDGVDTSRKYCGLLLNDELQAEILEKLMRDN